MNLGLIITVIQFICILHLLKVKFELTMWPAPSWLDSSVGRALHQYRRGHRFESCSALNFEFFGGFNFTAALDVCIPAMINHWIHILLCSSNIWSFDIIHLHSSPSHVYYEFTVWPAPNWLDCSVGRALHRYRRGYGFKSRSGLNFFQALIS